MPIIHHETTIAAPLMKVWRLFEDPVRNLPRISPPADAVVVESAELPMREGSHVNIVARDALGRRVKWRSKIEVYLPPHVVVFGMEARMVDVQVTGPFAAWRHSHELEAIDDKTTRLVDRVEYRPPYGATGMVLDWLYLRWKIRAMLRHRARAIGEMVKKG